MPSLLLVTGARTGETLGGREQLAWLHRGALKAIFGNRLIVCELSRSTASPLAALRGYIDGLSISIVDELVATARDKGVSQVYLDGSNLGLLAAALKRALPAVEVLTFCHNVEARFFFDGLVERPSPRSAAVLLANYRAERHAVRFSDRVIALSERDGALFKRVYGRGATDLLPMALTDRAPLSVDVTRGGTPYALFVGGGFYANLHGARWYARHVAPRITLPTVIVGRGMEALRTELEETHNIRVVGGVDDLAPWYRDAAVAIAPIFKGSGMKTKVAEALMFGKSVVGTAEAFSGYGNDVVAANWRCDDADGFVAALRITDAAITRPYSPAMREIYERDHSPAMLERRLAAILAPKIDPGHL